MTAQREWVDEMATEAEVHLLVMDGFDDCIVGIVTQFRRTFVVYDRTKVIAKLMEQGMTEEEAWEYHEFNQTSAFVGDNTPGFLDRAPVGKSTVENTHGAA